MKVFDIDDEKKLAGVYDKRMGHEIDGETLGEEFKGYIFRCETARCLCAAHVHRRCA